MRTAAVLLMLSAVLAVPTAASAAPRTSSGYDISYPQCPNSFPSSPAFGIVGVNDGIVYSPNPCLGAEYQWARRSSSTTQARAQFYANTANPGPTLSKHWPTGQQAPMYCDGSWSPGCSYDYGWNAAQDSFADAAGVAGSAPAAAAPWWLDVESANSWSTDTSLNIDDLKGGLAYLSTPASAGGAGVSQVGFYADASSWASIVGSSSVFSVYDSWVPGAPNLRAAKANCSATITGGIVKYAQYPSAGFDADFPCF